MSQFPHLRIGGRARFAAAAALAMAVSGTVAVMSGRADAARAAAASTPFNALFVCPESGALAAAGAQLLAGEKAAASVLNASGGILHHRVVTTVVDDGGSGVTAVSKTTAALSGGTRFNWAYGGCFGQDSLPLASVFAAHPTIPDFAPLPDNYVAPPQHANLFIAGTLTSTPEKALAAAIQARGIEKFAIVTGDDTTALQGETALEHAAKALGLTVTAVENVPDTAIDATAQYQAALASNPQAIASNNYTPVIGPIVAARAKLGSTIPLFGDAYWGSANLGALSTPAERKGIYIVTFPFLALGSAAEKTAAWQAFIRADHSFDPKPVISLYADLTGYDALMVMEAAAEKAGTISGPKILAALGELTQASQVPGFVGSFPLYKPDNHAWHLTPTSYETIRAGVSIGGLIQAGS